MIGRKQLHDAIDQGVPFVVKLSDGKEYAVPHRDYVSVAPKHEYFVVHDDEGYAHVLPITLITGITYRDPSHTVAMDH